MRKNKVVVMGAGESGLGAALLAKKEGLEVWVSDSKEIMPSYKRQLEVSNIPYEAGQHTEKKFFEADCIVKSPGIPTDVPLLKKAHLAGIPIISEIEFGYRYCSSPIVAITGSNGKTSTTHLIHHLLSQAGWEAKMAGNMGYSFAKALSEGFTGIFVLEVSSFQLDNIQSFRPNIGVLLNISPDHLDRYNYDFEAYASAKMKLVQRMTRENSLVYFGEDPMIKKFLQAIQGEFGKKAFGTSYRQGMKAWIEGESLNWLPEGKMDFSLVGLLGTHNQLNCLAAILVAKQFDLSDQEIKKGLRSFRPVPHRLEPVGTVEGITYINDSKATNIDAVKFALEAMEEPTIWIVGGVDKGNDYSVLEELVAQKVKGIVVLGSGIEKIKQAFSHHASVHANSMELAVEKATEIGREGDTVLLSPACASFDLFKNFEDRGEQFRKAVEHRIDRIQKN